MHDQIHHSRADGTHYPIEECHIFQAFRKREDTHADTEVFWRKDGTSFPAEYWSYPQRRDGKVVGAVVTFVDITDRKQAETRQAQSLQTRRRGKSTSRRVALAGIVGGEVQEDHRGGRRIAGPRFLPNLDD